MASPRTDQPRTIKSESGAIVCSMSVMQGEEAKSFRSTGRFQMCVIREGMNKNGDYNFQREAIKTGAKHFSRAQIVSGHPGWFEDPHARQPNRLIGAIGQCEVVKGDDGLYQIVGEAVITDPETRENFANLADAGFTDQVEFSIIAPVKAVEQVEGKKRWYNVTQFEKCISIDHVLRGAAGGRALVMQNKVLDDSSYTFEEEGDLMTNEQILAMQTENTTLKADVLTAQGLVAAEKKRADEAEQIIATQAQALLAEQCRTAINASALPDASKTRLTNQSFKTVDEAKAAVTAEVDYLKSLGVTAQGRAGDGRSANDGPPAGSGVAGFGVTQAVVTDPNRPAPAKVSTDPEKDPGYVTAYQRLRQGGVDDASAKRQARHIALID